MGRRRDSQTAIGHLSRLRQRPTAIAPRIGLALGGGFARGIAHAGVLKVFERHGIHLHCITGVSAGSIVAAAYASGTGAEEIARVGCSMRFRDVARWRICRMGFMGSDRMKQFLSGIDGVNEVGRRVFVDELMVARLHPPEQERQAGEAGVQLAVDFEPIR